MRWLLSAPAAVAAVAVLVTPASGLMVRINSPLERAVTADVVVVGKVTAIETETVEAAPFPGSPNKVAHKVAVIKIETPLAGAAGMTHVKIGFVPPPPAPANPPAGGLRPIRPRGLQVPELKEGQEFLFFLTRHPDGGFYTMPVMGPPVDVKEEIGKKELEAVKAALAALADPMKGLKSEKAADRYLTATALVTKYRTVPASVRELDQVPIPADESALILKGLLDGDWAKFDGNGPNAMVAVNSLGLTAADGWMRPAAKAGENYNEATKKAFAAWLDGPGKTYRIKQFVPKKK